MTTGPAASGEIICRRTPPSGPRGRGDGDRREESRRDRRAGPLRGRSSRREREDGFHGCGKSFSVSLLNTTDSYGR